MPNRAKRRRTAQRRAAQFAPQAAMPAENITTENETTAPEPSHASAAQIAANRENSTHSTGPRSEIGKATVSQNRRTHGLLSSVFTVLACENQAEYDLLLTTLISEHKPDNTTECLLVTSMAQHRWLLDRATRLQETCLDQATAQVTDQKLFSLYLRYATTHERAFHKCLNDLLKLRKEKQTRQIGFESQKRQTERHESRQRLDDIELCIRQAGQPSGAWSTPTSTSPSLRAVCCPASSLGAKLWREETAAGMENSEEKYPLEVATAA